MSELKELKVGDLVSVKLHDRPNWSCYPTITEDQCREIQNNPDWLEWQHGIHSSLIPEGFAIVPLDEIEAAKVELSKLKNNVMVFRDEKNMAIKRWSDLTKEKGQLHDLLNAAHTEISRLKKAPKPTDK